MTKTNKSYCFAYRRKITCVEKIKSKFRIVPNDHSFILHEEVQFDQQNSSLLSSEQRKKKIYDPFFDLFTDKTSVCVDHSR